jgi:exodeoxyribonuclease VII large subunit
LSLRLAAGVRSNVQAHRVRTALERERIAVLSERARRGLLGFLRYNNAKVDRAAQLLTALSYRRVLARGFTLVRDAQGRPLRSAATVAPGHRMNVEFADGRVGAIAEKVESIGPQVAIPAPLLNPVKRSRRGSGSDPGQGSLFD